MEQLLANLLNHANEEEEGKILTIHQRLQTIFQNQSDLRGSKDRLLALILLRLNWPDFCGFK